MMKFALRVAGKTCAVAGRWMTIGRDADNGVVLHDPGVSHHHARVRERRGRVYLQDLNSTNGTLINGIRIHDTQTLRLGDRVRVGATTMQVLRAPGRAVETRPRLGWALGGIVVLLVLVFLFLLLAMR